MSILDFIIGLFSLIVAGCLGLAITSNFFLSLLLIVIFYAVLFIVLINLRYKYLWWVGKR
jgi:hypothetical protein